MQEVKHSFFFAVLCHNSLLLIKRGPTAHAPRNWFSR
ncbi:hypothetical protein SOVF_120640 [Spinacia oleracea]|nr:hypothetical protein SOVF_120640 [Spinacia oleracea]